MYRLKEREREIYIYIYTYTDTERERERERQRKILIIFIYIYIEREREREIWMHWARVLRCLTELLADPQSSLWTHRGAARRAGGPGVGPHQRPARGRNSSVSSLKGQNRVGNPKNIVEFQWE